MLIAAANLHNCEVVVLNKGGVGGEWTVHDRYPPTNGLPLQRLCILFNDRDYYDSISTTRAGAAAADAAIEQKKQQQKQQHLRDAAQKQLQQETLQLQEQMKEKARVMEEKMSELRVLKESLELDFKKEKEKVRLHVKNANASLKLEREKRQEAEELYERELKRPRTGPQAPAATATASAPAAAVCVTPAATANDRSTPFISPYHSTHSQRGAGGAAAVREVGCFHCGELGHWASNCTNRNSTSSTASKGCCFKCSSPDHWAADCPGGTAVAPASGQKGNCRKCGKAGHWSNDCPTSCSPAPATKAAIKAGYSANQVPLGIGAGMRGGGMHRQHPKPAPAYVSSAHSPPAHAMAEAPGIDMLPAGSSTGIKIPIGECGWEDCDLLGAELQSEVAKMNKDAGHVPRTRRFYQTVAEMRRNLKHAHGARIIDFYADASRARALGVLPFKIGRSGSTELTSVA
jgi:hypothetical protein